MPGHRLNYRQPFDAEMFRKEEERRQRRKLACLQNMAATLNYQLVPNQ